MSFDKQIYSETQYYLRFVILKPERASVPLTTFGVIGLSRHFRNFLISHANCSTEKKPFNSLYVYWYIYQVLRLLNTQHIFKVTLCMLGNFSCFCCHLLTIIKINFFQKNSLRNTIRVSNGLEPRSGS